MRDVRMALAYPVRWALRAHAKGSMVLALIAVETCE